MPLRKGSSKKAFNFNVKELIESWRKKGSIGGQKLNSMNKARKKALAIAFAQKESS